MDVGQFLVQQRVDGTAYPSRLDELRAGAEDGEEFHLLFFSGGQSRAVCITVSTQTVSWRISYKIRYAFAEPVRVCPGPDQCALFPGDLQAALQLLQTEDPVRPLLAGCLQRCSPRFDVGHGGLLVSSERSRLCNYLCAFFGKFRFNFNIVHTAPRKH